MSEAKETPEEKYTEFAKHNELLYTFDETGQYRTRVGLHDDHEQELIKQAWDIYADRIEEARQKVLSGKVSPIVYFMERDLLDPSTLSSHVGIATWRVKRHFKPNNFKKLSQGMLQKYAEAFKITVEQLKNIE